MESANVDYDDMITISFNNLTTILNLSNNLAKRIKEQVMDVIEHLIDSALLNGY